ncbi:CinA family protein, partial [Aquitalea magnusonii]
MDKQAAALAAQLGQLLLARGETVATAESCTGGMIAAALTDIAGSSAWFGYGLVSY